MPSTSHGTDDNIISRLSVRLDARASEKSRAFWEKYLKGVIPFRGVPMGEIRVAVHAWWKADGPSSLPIPAQKALALRLFEGGFCEDKLAGTLVLQELLLPQLGFAAIEGRMARWQPYVYGAGQLIHVLGLAWSGGYGVQRKVAGAEQVLTTLPQKIGMGMMGAGGLIAVILAIRWALRISKWVFLAALFVGGGIWTAYTLYNRTEPKFLTPIFDVLAEWLPTKDYAKPDPADAGAPKKK